MERENSQIHLQNQRPRIMKTILNFKRNSGRTTIPDLKLYYRVIMKKKLHGICTVTDTLINVIESKILKYNYSYGYLIFDKEVINIQRKTESISNIWYWSKWYTLSKKN